MDGKRGPVVLILQVVEDAEGQVVVMGGMLGE